MRIRYNIEKLGEILNDLSVLTGISIAFLDADNHRLCEFSQAKGFCAAYQMQEEYRSQCRCADQKLLERCRRSGQYEYHICHAGLYDAAMPIVKSGVTVGYILMGRIRSDRSPDVVFGPDGSDLTGEYRKLPFFRDAQLDSLRTLLPNILFSNAVELEKDGLIEEMQDYIEQNLSGELSVDTICKQFYISKNNLYRCFREQCQDTVNSYIVRRRMEKAKELLMQTAQPICVICGLVGIPNYTYFCKLFRKQVGVSPTEYRNSPSHEKRME